MIRKVTLNYGPGEGMPLTLMYLQKRTRALAGESLQPDALVQLEREETTSFVSPLYPNVKTCPRHGCWNFMFRCTSESYRHEQVFLMTQVGPRPRRLKMKTITLAIQASNLLLKKRLKKANLPAAIPWPNTASRASPLSRFAHPVLRTASVPIPRSFAGEQVSTDVLSMLFLSKADWSRGQTVRQRQGRQPVFAVVPRRLLPTIGTKPSSSRSASALRSVWRCPAQTVSAIAPCAPPIILHLDCARKLNFYCSVCHWPLEA
jgi:hypothetical protein